MKRNNRKSIYDSREFDSDLELRAYKLLQMLRVKFTFHERTFTLLEGYKVHAYSQKTKKIYKSSVDSMNYTPEFIIPAPGDLELIIEMKGFFESAARLKWKIFKSQLKSNQRALLLKNLGDLETILAIYEVPRGLDNKKFTQQFKL
jgi:hypothetical protein